MIDKDKKPRKRKPRTPTGNLPWRPRKFTDPDEMFQVGYDYLTKCNEEGKPLTITGLILALDCSKDTFYEYSKGEYNDNEHNFTDPCKKLRLIVENGYEKLLHSGRPVGGIFALKNFGWVDTHHIEQQIKTKKLEPEERQLLIDQYIADNQKLIDIKATDIVDIDDEDIIFDN